MNSVPRNTRNIYTQTNTHTHAGY